VRCIRSATTASRSSAPSSTAKWRPPCIERQFDACVHTHTHTGTRTHAHTDTDTYARTLASTRTHACARSHTQHARTHMHTHTHGSVFIICIYLCLYLHIFSPLIGGEATCLRARQLQLLREHSEVRGGVEGALRWRMRAEPQREKQPVHLQARMRTCVCVRARVRVCMCACVRACVRARAREVSRGCACGRASLRICLVRVFVRLLMDRRASVRECVYPRGFACMSVCTAAPGLTTPEHQRGTTRSRRGASRLRQE
jgi:hypothetical protein